MVLDTADQYSLATPCRQAEITRTQITLLYIMLWLFISWKYCSAERKYTIQERLIFKKKSVLFSYKLVRNIKHCTKEKKSLLSNTKAWPKQYLGFFAFIFLFYVWHFIQFPIFKIYLKYYYFEIPAVYTCIFVRHFLKEY